jgi:hypothetical protein
MNALREPTHHLGVKKALQRRVDQPEHRVDRRSRLKVVSGKHFATFAIADEGRPRINRSILREINQLVLKILNI